MFNFLSRFYFLSKLTTSLVLLILLILISYLFIKAFLEQNDQNNSTNIQDLSDRLLNLTNIIEQNSNNLNSIKGLAEDNKKSVKDISMNLSSNQNKTDHNLVLQINNLANENKKLKKDLENISSFITSLKNSRPIDQDFQVQSRQMENIIELIKLKISNGSNFNEEIELLEKLELSEENLSNIERLSILASRNFQGLNKLKIDYDQISSDYLNHYYSKKNKNKFIKYIFNIISIQPNLNSNIEDENVLKLSLAKKNLLENNMAQSIRLLASLKDTGYFFSQWIIRAENYDQMIKLLNKL